MHDFGDGETAWMVYFEDQDKRPEIFTGRGAEVGAKARYLDARQAWSCHLFYGVAWNISRDVEPTFSRVREVKAFAEDDDACERELDEYIKRNHLAETDDDLRYAWNAAWEIATERAADAAAADRSLLNTALWQMAQAEHALRCIRETVDNVLTPDEEVYGTDDSRRA